MYLWYLEKIWRKSAIPDTKKVSGTNLCRHDLAESAKSADFWLSGQHVADMSATFPIRTLEKYYDVAVDLDGKEFVKIELDWDYENKRL
jgi:hypothetical protein